MNHHISTADVSASENSFAPVPPAFFAGLFPQQLQAVNQFYALAWQKAQEQVKAEAEERALQAEWRDFDFDLGALRRLHALLAELDG